MEYKETYNYVLNVFDKLGIEEYKDIKQKKTAISKNGLQLMDENIPSNILVFKCTYLLENMGFYVLYGGKLFIELIKLDNGKTKVDIYGKEDPHKPSLFRKEKIYDLDLILSKLNPPIPKISTDHIE